MNQIYFVDINLSADSTEGVGSNISPYNYEQFVVELSANDETTDINTFYLRGFRPVSATSIDESTSAENVWPLTKKSIVIDSWEDDPWTIQFSSDFYLKSSVDWFSKVEIKRGLLSFDPMYLRFSKDEDVLVVFDGCWLNGTFKDSSSYYSGGTLKYLGDTLQNFRLFNTNFSDVDFQNSIIYSSSANDYYLIENTVFTNFSFDNTVSNRYIWNETSANKFNILNPSSFGLTYLIDYCSNNDLWDSTNAKSSVFLSAVSAFDTNNLSYLGDSFSNIDIQGNLDYCSPAFFGGKRDGIGALYFDPLDVTLSADPISGSVPWTVSATHNAFTNFSASNILLSWGDSSVTSTSTLNLLSKVYAEKGTYEISATTLTKNGWYTDESYLTVYPYSGLVSATDLLIFSAVDSLTPVTSGGSNRIYYLSAAGVYGTPYEFIFSANTFNVSASSDIAIQKVSASNFFDITPLGNNIIWLYFNKDQINEFSLSANLNLSASPSATFYVDLETTTSGDGTTALPFNYSQFLVYVTSGGFGSINDSYRLKGVKYITKDTNTSLSWYPFNVDSRKKFTIRDWDVSDYGPWMLSVVESEYPANSILNFEGTLLKNGIIYNKAYKYGSYYYGGTMKFSSLYNMWVVSQGEGQFIEWCPVDESSKTELSGVQIKGCTINSKWMKDNLTNYNSESYIFKVEDSVLSDFCKNFNLPNSFLSAVGDFKNNAFGTTEDNIESSILNSTFVNNVFGWTVPDDWPLLVDNEGYGEDFAWLSANPTTFRPFSNIPTPPNPGYGFSLYPGYHIGLYGYKRIDWK